jgi:hypothetical protein
MLIYVLDFFDGGLKPPKPPFESATAGYGKISYIDIFSSSNLQKY